MANDSERKPRLSDCQALTDGPIPDNICKEEQYPDKPYLLFCAAKSNKFIPPS